MNYQEMITRELETSPNGYTSTELANWIMLCNPFLKERGVTKKQVVSNVSSRINKMWKNDEVYIYQHRKGIRGGTVYKLNKEI